MIFQEHDESFELVLSASSANEERAWKTETLKATASLAAATNPPTEGRRYSFSSFDMAPLDRAGHQGSLARRASMRSLGASRVKWDLQHVVIRKTHCPNRMEDATAVNGEIERPKAPYPQAGVILTTRRNDRIRLERFIADVYTRDALPFPGMVLGKGDILRPGAIMRRFSLRPGFGRRSTSLSTPHRPAAADGLVGKPNGTADEEDSKEHEVLDGGREFEHKKPLKADDSPGSLARAKTVRFKQITKQISRSDFWSVGEATELSHGGAEPCDWKGPVLQTIINALGRRMKRSRSSMAMQEAMEEATAR